MWRELVIITSYPTRANGIIVLVNSQTGFCHQFLFPQFYKGESFFNLAHYFPYDVKLRLLAHSPSFLANQKARNAIVGAENLLKADKPRRMLVEHEEFVNLYKFPLTCSPGGGILALYIGGSTNFLG